MRSAAGGDKAYKPTWPIWDSLVEMFGGENELTSTNENSEFPQKDLLMEWSSRDFEESISPNCTDSYECVKSPILPEPTRTMAMLDGSMDAPKVEKHRDDIEEEDRIFFSSLLLHVSKVPQTFKLSMRNEIMTVVNKFAYFMEPRKPTPPPPSPPQPPRSYLTYGFYQGNYVPMYYNPPAAYHQVRAHQESPIIYQEASSIKQESATFDQESFDAYCLSTPPLGGVSTNRRSRKRRTPLPYT
ncbi:hypothetical protein TKK_0010288 [Trichogramma kaykai]|uniref:BESS domain-containing protein n=1 Tax=Trichogramma kaykai TaxID=54128 RepID=A0ABD2WYN4_9HYME